MARTSPLTYSRSPATPDVAMSFESDASVREALEANRIEAEGTPHPEDVSPQSDEQEPSVDPLSLFLPETGSGHHHRLAAPTHLTGEMRASPANALDARMQAIDDGLLKANQTAELLATLERRRLASLTERDQLLHGSEHIVADLEQRAAGATAALERWIGDLEAQRQLMEEAVAQLQQRAAGTTADLERRLGEFDAQRQAIDRALLDAPQVANTLLELQARVTQLAGTGQELGKAAQVVAELERRTAEANEDLEQRLGTLDARKRAIDRALIDTNRIADVLSGLETRMAGLAEKHELLDRVGDDVVHLERRVDTVAARLELAARTRRQLEHEFGNPQARLERVIDAAPISFLLTLCPSHSAARCASPGSVAFAFMASNAGRRLRRGGSR